MVFEILFALAVLGLILVLALTKPDDAQEMIHGEPLPDAWTDLGYISEDGLVGYDGQGAPLYAHQVDTHGRE